MVKTKTVTEYRVTSVREGSAPKVKRYRSMTAVNARIGRMISDEPWRFYGSKAQRLMDGAALACCNGSECGCGGVTVAQEAAAQRAALPKLMNIRVESRVLTIAPWEPVSFASYESAAPTVAAHRSPEHPL